LPQPTKAADATAVRATILKMARLERFVMKVLLKRGYSGYGTEKQQL
jgi:hypothetical protein